MALTSPGVEVTIIDQSQYLPAPTGSVPFVLLATAQDKPNPNGIGIAQGTTAANANKLTLVSSQRDLVTLFGTPYFYSAAGGTPINGDELNEYGLLAAYSALGITNQIYVLRADINLSELEASAGRPVGAPANGTYWLDTTDTVWGMYFWNATTETFSLQSPIVITDNDLVTVGGYPLQSLGNIGSYAVVAIPQYLSESPVTYKSPIDSYQFFFKNSSNEWVVLGGKEWLESVPAVIGSESNPTLTVGNTFTLSQGNGTATITVQGAGQNNVAGIAAQINNLGWGDLSAAVVDGKLQLFSTQYHLPINDAPNIVVGSGTGTVLADMGLPAGTYNQPAYRYSTSAQAPLWGAGQNFPRPTGSVWMKLGSAGNGMNIVVDRFNSATSTWENQTVRLFASDSSAIANLDSTGGQAIPQGTIYGQSTYGSYTQVPVYLWRRFATGPTVVTGSNTDPNFNAGPYTANVYVTLPSQITLAGPFEISLDDNSDAVDFVTAWAAANIPYTIAEVTETGAIQLTHTEGGDIILDDVQATTGLTNGLFTEAGFIPGTTDLVKYNLFGDTIFTTTQSSTSGAGAGLVLDVLSNFGTYTITGIDSGGTGFAVGDTVTFSGTTLGGVTPGNNLVVKVSAVSSGVVTEVEYSSGVGPDGPSNFSVACSNWTALDYVANQGAPVASPDNGTDWYYSPRNQVDIMVNTQGGWKGYRNVPFNSSGFPLPSGSNTTDPNGPIVSASIPTVQSDGTPLSYGDIWIDTSDLENYPVISRWQSVSGEDQWVLIDNTDQVSGTGILFADARWATNGTTSPVDDPIPTITSLLTSNYLDLDAPESNLYPVGMLLFNTRRSGSNVKQFVENYFNSTDFPGESLPTQKDAWVTISGLQSNGAPYMGRQAQRAVVVKALRAAIDTNLQIRDEDNFFNLISCPNYVELQPNMIALNTDRGETAFIVGDTPMGLADIDSEITAWATNATNQTSSNEQGLVNRSPYMGLFYPSGLTNDLSGNLVVVPPSHMMLRTILRNDEIAYPWLAPAGVRRGLIDNATAIGYLNRDTGEFTAIKTRLGVRDTLYTNFINPLVFFSGNGLLNYGNKTSFSQAGLASSSALDRINVARLVAYVRRQLQLAARPFVFEPNDTTTRNEIKGVVESLMLDLVAKRGVYDYLVVCDESNNTPARIDRNELWVDVALEPVKAAEFIYIPVRILNTGELSGNA